MAVGFGTVKSVNIGAKTSAAFAMTGVVSGQPILLWVANRSSTSAPSSVTDNFTTPYTWTLVPGSVSTANGEWHGMYVGTQGAGTSGTVTPAYGSSMTMGGIAVPCTGCDPTAVGLAVIDVSNSGSASATSATLSMTPAGAGSGAFFCADGTLTASLVEPSSPWVATTISGSFGVVGSGVTQSSPTAGASLSAVWSNGSTSEPWEMSGIVVLAAPGTKWTQQSARSSQSVGGTTATPTCTPQPNVGELMILDAGAVHATSAFTSATPSDNGSGGWQSVIPGFETRSTLTSQQWWKVATQADFNAWQSGGTYTITVTFAGGSGTITNDVQCALWSVPTGYMVMGLDCSGGATPTAATSTTLSPSSGSTHPTYTDALAVISSVSPTSNRGVITGTNTFTGTSAATALTATFSSSPNNFINSQFAGLVQPSATAGTNVWAIAWTNSVGPNVVGAIFTYAPVTTGAASISLSSASTDQAQDTAGASLSISAASTDYVQEAVAAALSLSASSTDQVRDTAAAAIVLSAASTDESYLSAAATLVLAAGATDQAGETGNLALALVAALTAYTDDLGAAALALVAGTTPQVLEAAAAAIVLAASATGTLAQLDTGAAALSLSAGATDYSTDTSAANLSLTASAVSFVSDTASLSLALASGANSEAQVSSSCSLSLAAGGADQAVGVGAAVLSLLAASGDASQESGNAAVVLFAGLAQSPSTVAATIQLGTNITPSWSVAATIALTLSGSAVNFVAPPPVAPVVIQRAKPTMVTIQQDPDTVVVVKSSTEVTVQK